MEKPGVLIENDGMRRDYLILYLLIGIIMTLMGIADLFFFKPPTTYVVVPVVFLFALIGYYLALLEYYSKNDFVELTLNKVTIRSTPQLGTGFLPIYLELEYPAIKSVDIVGIKSRFSDKVTIALQISYEDKNGLRHQKIILDRFPAEAVIKIGQLLEVSANIGNKVKQFADQHPELVSKAKTLISEASKFIAKMMEENEQQTEPMDDE